jgi:AntA/AntB antirepressor/Phage integrase, N-terminal
MVMTRGIPVTDAKLDSFLKSAEAVVRAGAATRINGAVASLRTQEYSLQVVSESCRRLHRLGFLLGSVDGLTQKHIDALVGSWVSQGLSNKTIQNQFSRIKVFASWLGKPWLVSDAGAAGHLPGVDPKSLQVRTVADKSKSLTENGIDVTDLIRRAHAQDERFGAMMLLGVAFGLRKKELLRIKPWKADKGVSLDIDGSVAKNGRFRSIALEDGRCGQAQRMALNHAKSICRKYDTLGWVGKTFKQNENRYYYFMKRIFIHTNFPDGIMSSPLVEIGSVHDISVHITILREYVGMKPRLCVDAHQMIQFFCIGRVFRKWFSESLAENGFVSGRDYAPYNKRHTGQGRPAFDFLALLPMAREMAACLPHNFRQSSVVGI